MKNPLPLTNVKVLRPDPPRGGSRARQNRSPSSKNYSSDREATPTNRMHRNVLEACGKEVLLFLVPFQNLVFKRFGVVLDKVISAYFLSNSLIFNCVK